MKTEKIVKELNTELTQAELQELVKRLAEQVVQLELRLEILDDLNNLDNIA